MSVSRLHGRPNAAQTFARAKLSAPVLTMLAVLRWYAIFAVGVAVYSFVHSLR